MSLSDNLEWLNIGGKPVAVVEDHHHALMAWAIWHRGHGRLRLVTIDHHCDTQDAFLRAAYDGKRGTDVALQSALIGAIDPAIDASIEAAVVRLRHDEHIDAAIRSGVIDAAFVIHEQDMRTVRSHEDAAYWAKAQVLRDTDPAAEFFFLRNAPKPLPPMTYMMPEDRMMAIHPTWYYTGPDLVRPWPDRVIESDHLDDRLAIFERALTASDEAPLEGNPYILDLDMDAFNTVKALHPDDPTTFYRLVAGAVGITIARERMCCAMEWRDHIAMDEEANFTTLLGRLAAAITR